MTLNTSQRPEHVICILGMHRSGTSALTGSLQASGVELGKHHTWNRHNQKGNRENQDIVDLHDQILLTNKGSWDKPPKKVYWLNEQINQVKEILNQNKDSAYWGFKDPRALLTLSQWKILIPDMQYIGIFRHPLSVATSLNKRGEISIKQGLELWYTYNKRLLTEQKASSFPLLCFDWSEEKLHSQLNKTITSLGLTPLNDDTQFYNKELHHHSHQSDKELPWKIRRLYKRLRAISEK